MLKLFAAASAVFALTAVGAAHAALPPHPGDYQLRYRGMATGGYLGDAKVEFYLHASLAPRDDYLEAFGELYLPGVEYDWYNTDYSYNQTGLTYTLFLAEQAYEPGHYVTAPDLFISADTSGHGSGSTSFGITFFDVSGAPEPSTWALMIVGVGVAGAALRRRCASVAA